ncbi:copper amine oxidase N-terminal domain-containing protein [Paenibacillus tritici]|uniref:Copper amine oxidase N-terminal domain-containing protein n=1 Tax=Paenibacillus tritici TaxID=1873425 RepID=A0ABX2DVR8_9BACL|nr:copper amine oxidase N-terminal domain-containing protein [Paenibacillus tritici]
MKKLWISMVAGLLVLPMLFQAPAQAAAKPIRVIIDGVTLTTDQPPVMVKGRTMVPLRAIFEAFNADIKWNQKTQTVTAYKDDTTVVLKIGSKIATINNKAVSLDVPGQNLKGRTMVPTRFVSEALGREVGWNKEAQLVTITTPVPAGGNAAPVSGVAAQDIGDYGDGRDLQVSFNRAADESLVDHYRVLIVKTGTALDLSSALAVGSYNYSVVLVTGANPVVKLNAATRTLDGDLIKNNQGYTAYVVTVGKGNNTSALSGGAAPVTLTNKAVPALGTVQVKDTSDYGDGRDISVSFSKLADETKVSSYRIFVVKASNTSVFDLGRANAVASANYTQTNKTGNNISLNLLSGSRDTDGALIKTGVGYRVFALAVDSSNAANNVLSQASAVLTLSNVGISSLSVTDVNDYNDGRDLKVSFNHASDETYISQYRIMVVPTSYYSSFSLNDANNVQSANYTAVNTSGSATEQILNSSSRDVRGALIKNGTSYKVYVLSAGNGNNPGSNVLSAASSAITLLNTSGLSAISGLNVSDVSDYGDGRDLKVSFTHAGDESYISHYRILVVPTNYYSSFSLSDANNAANYITASTSGNSTSQVLDASSRDVRGAVIKPGTSYRVYVLTVRNGSYQGANLLSDGSAAITLSAKEKLPVTSVTNVTYGMDNGGIVVKFTKSSRESNLSEYRVFVVPSKQSFGSAEALGVQGSYYRAVAPNGSNQSVAAAGRDINGNSIVKGTKYKVYVLAVANSSGIQNGGLSDSSEEFEL